MVGTFDLGLAPGDRFLSHALVSSDCVWLLGVRKHSQAHFISSLRVERGLLKAVDVPVPTERFPISIAAVSQRKHGSVFSVC